MASDTSLIRPARALDLHQRPSWAVLQLVRTEEIGGMAANTPWGSRTAAPVMAA